MSWWAYFWQIGAGLIFAACFIGGALYESWPLNTKPSHRFPDGCEHRNTEPVYLALGQHVADLCLGCGKTIYIAGWEL